MAVPKKKQSKTVDYTLYLLLRVVSTALHCFPLTAAMRLAAFTWMRYARRQMWLD